MLRLRSAPSPTRGEGKEDREGRSDDRKRAPAQGLSNVVAEVGKVPLKSIHVVICEGRGRHTMFGGEPGPEFKPAGGG